MRALHQLVHVLDRPSLARVDAADRNVEVGDYHVRVPAVLVLVHQPGDAWQRAVLEITGEPAEAFKLGLRAGRRSSSTPRRGAGSIPFSRKMRWIVERATSKPMDPTGEQRDEKLEWGGQLRKSHGERR